MSQSFETSFNEQSKLLLKNITALCCDVLITAKCFVETEATAKT